MTKTLVVDPLIRSARKTLEVEAGGINQLAIALNGPLGDSFVRAARTIARARGRVILSGIGKSGHVGRKVASTLASTGTPAIFVHATEASHGDLGMITPDDVLVVFSNSGETTELKDLVVYSRRFSVPLVAVTGNAASTLGAAADIVLELPNCTEACPNGLAPTTSTTMQLVLGDALAIALLEERGFTIQDFKILHPGGRLGAALTFVRDIMHPADRLPLCRPGVIMADGLVTMTEKSFGCLGVVAEDGELIGIVTDGDLRRHMSPQLLSSTVSEIMTPDPIVALPDELASAALERINTSGITSLFVVENRRPVGIVHIHDLLRAGII